ncbi:MAG: translation initiation factor IF-6 [Candidatus Nanohaloarchaeota archaeon QJJ-9]|nr:translation initiation factor IF-6 [Candidatus Nanohaloarchaeota archaeon QJJ-9]
MADKNLVLTDYKGDPNLGLYGFATDSYAVLAPEYKKKSSLDVKVVETHVAETPLAGMFAAGNSNRVLLPDTVRDHERKKLEEKGIDFYVVDSNYTALGNLVLANDNGCIISTTLEDEKSDIEEALEVPVEVGTVAGLNIVGSAGIATNNGVLLHREASEEELEKVEEVLDVDGDIGSVNFGSPYVGTGVLANSKAALVGNNTKGPELGRIEKSLGFLD